MKKILYITRTYPYAPAYGGDISYSRGIIESLAQVSNLTVVAASNGDADRGRKKTDGVNWVITGRTEKKRVFSMISSLPMIAWKERTSEYERVLIELLSENWDAIIVDHIGACWAAEHVSKHKRRAKFIYISHEHEASVRLEKYSVYGGGLALRLAMQWDGAKIRRLEARMIRETDAITVINPDDEALYRRDGAGQSFITLTPGYSESISSGERLQPSQRRVVMLGGRGSKQKQVILEEWLKVSSPIFERNAIELVVVGPIGEELKTRFSKSYPSVQFLGYVEDISAFLSTCRLGVVADFVGGGFKVRLLTYIFSRVPIFAVKGAVSGLGFQAGNHFFESPSLERLASDICQFVDEEELLTRAANNAFDAAIGNYEWADRGRAIINYLDAN